MAEQNQQFRDTTGVSLSIPMFEFVAMMASLLALNALAIDTMLPALEHIGEFYQREDANDQQLVIFAYIFGFGFPQLFFGPLSDRYGRKGLLQICLIGFSAMALQCMLSTGFWALLAFRFCQGVFAAGVRVIAGAIIRDLTSGRTMARIMSLVFTVFMIVPIIAPGIGTLVMTFGDWKWTFGVLGVAGMLVFFWTLFRLPYTLPSDMRQPLNIKHIGRSYFAVLKTRVALGYMLASGIAFGSLFAFIGASEQIFDEVFGKGDRFWIWFAVVASGIAVANITNARLVEKLGMRRISHSVLLCFIVLAMVNLMAMKFSNQNFWFFLPLFTLMFGCFGMMGANFSSIALEPLGKIAGTASAAYGFATTTLSAWLGWFIARQFDGTVYPILIGFSVLGLSALLIVIWTEKGKLFEIGQANK
jgi:DHA1 family bicyclomycin/chloramphenicol resistance-like MFS transporter